VSRLQLAAIALSVAGIGVSVYLTVLHYIGFAPACPASGPVNCEAVLSSPYAVILGTAVPTSAEGIVWFAVSAGLWLRAFGRVQLAWSLVGLATVIYLLFVEIVRVGAICLWCTAAHVLVVAILLVAVTMQGQERQQGAY
jgi:uncharacterized membrane protein